MLESNQLGLSACGYEPQDSPFVIPSNLEFNEILQDSYKSLMLIYDSWRTMCGWWYSKPQTTDILSVPAIPFSLHPLQLILDSNIHLRETDVKFFFSITYLTSSAFRYTIFFTLLVTLSSSFLGSGTSPLRDRYPFCEMARKETYSSANSFRPGITPICCFLT